MSYNNFTLEIEDDGVAIVTWSMPDKKLNLLDEETIQELDSICEKVKENNDVKSVILTSGKDSFSSGANVKAYYQSYRNILHENKGKSEEETNRILFEYSQQLSLTLRKIETCGKPWVALIVGICMGGGLEVALACHLRISADDASVQIALPEIRIGFIPGGGGTQRISRMCDLQSGMQFMLKGNIISGQKAKSMNIVDVLAPKKELFDTAKQMLKQGVDPVRPWDKKGFKPPSGNVYTPNGIQFWAAANAIYRRESNDNFLSGRRLLESINHGLSLPMDLALELESRNFLNVVTSKQSINMTRSLFFSMNELNNGGQRPKDEEATDTKKIGILGAGFMGSGIALVSAKAGIDVVLIDRDMESAEKGKAHCNSLISQAIKRGKYSESQKEQLMKRILPSASYEDLKDCDLVIEAVFEDRDIKKTVTEATESVIGPDTIFASNTSTLPITSLAESSKRPENFIGIHFFSPVDRMLLVEIIMGEKTNSRALAKAFDYIRKIRKTPIVVNDGRGFYTSRVVMTYVREGMLLLGDGVPAALIENLGKMTGMPVGPLALADEVALDLSWKIVLATKKDLGEKYVPTPLDEILEKMVVEQKRFGRKNKKGFYEYPEKGEKYLWSRITEITGKSKPAENFDYDEVKQRLLCIMALETARIFEEKIITDVRAADVGSILGFGFPPYSGGTLSYIEFVGLPEFIAMCEKLEKNCGERFKPNKLLYDMAKNNQTFYPNFLDVNLDNSKVVKA